MHSISRFAASAARRVGIVVSRYPPYFSLEHHLRNLIRDVGIELVIDIGAHHGEFRDVLRQDCRYSGRIISFEPASEAFGVLSAIKDENWERHQLALGSNDGVATLHLYGSTVFNSILVPSGYGKDLFDLSGRGSEETRVRRLDDVLLELGVDLASCPSLIKIDTQGGDRAVIAGAPVALSAACVLQTEIPVLKLYEGSPEFIECLAEVLDLGFEVTGLFPVTRDREHRIIEFDCVLRRVDTSGELMSDRVPLPSANATEKARMEGRSDLTLR